MPTAKTATRTKPPDTRDAILDTALTLFTERGYFNTSVHHIQKAAGISIGSIYHHFKNKEAVATALYDRLTEEMSRMILTVMEAHHTVQDRCRAVVKALFALTGEHPEKMAYMLHANHAEFINARKPVCSSVPFEMISSMVRNGMDTGEIRPMDPVAATVSIFGGALRLIHLKLDNALPRPLPDYFDEVWEAAWRGVAR